MGDLIDRILDSWDRAIRIVRGQKYPSIEDDNKLIALLFLLIGAIYGLINFFTDLSVGESSYAERDNVAAEEEGVVVGVREGEVEIAPTQNGEVDVLKEPKIYKVTTPGVKVGDKVSKGAYLGTKKVETTYTAVHGQTLLEGTTVERVENGPVTKDEVELTESIKGLNKQGYKIRQSSYDDGYKYKETVPHYSVRGQVANQEEAALFCVVRLMSVLGLTDIQASAFVGNFMAESGLLPIAFNRAGGNYGAQGIAQWRAGRVEVYIKKYGKMQVYDNNLTHQIDYVIYELSTGYKRAIPSTNMDIVQAAAHVQVKYEVCNDGTANRRESAKQVLAWYRKRYGEPMRAQRGESVHREYISESRR